jgi:cytochrome P450
MQDMTRKLKSNFRLWFGPQPMVVICNPVDAGRVLRGNEPKGFTYSLLRPWLGNGLLTSAGKEWHTMRHLLTPAFHFEVLRDYFSVIPSHLEVCARMARSTPLTTPQVFVRKLEEVARSGQSIDLFSFITLLTLDVVGAFHCLFTPFVLTGRRRMRNGCASAGTAAAQPAVSLCFFLS